MGILDDAIREHLELKRQHGADESEVEGLEAEAFGPADRPDAIESPTGDGAPVDPSSFESEAMTQVISPGSALTVPAGEGDQLDKVFEAKREEAATAEQSSPPEAEQGASAAEAAEELRAPEAETADEPEAAPDPEVSGETAERNEPAEADYGEGDAGDALEAERQHLAGQPTEHYDVDAAIAEEDEIDLLSESRLADELDRALDGPGGAAGAPAEVRPEPEPEPEPESQVSPEPEPEPEAESAPAAEDQDDAEDSDPADSALATGEAVEEEEPGDSEFFDQDDPLEGTPDFLEETPEHDRLWFEQKEPKDFDFGD
jgi:hypothetical protein